MKRYLMAGSALALALPAPMLAQDHTDHSGHAMPETPAADEAPDPSTMDHSQMHRGQMNHAAMDHGAMDHGQMNHASGPPSLMVDHSGTARLPLAEGMAPGLHFGLGSGWTGMVHGYALGAYTDHGGPRGDDKFAVQSMAMLMADKQLDGAHLQLRAMMSAEPLMSNRGYPNLFATGETYGGGIPIVDRQHPHDLFMELSARVDVDVAPDTTAFLYGGPVAEPALGPSAFMHRDTARYNPEPPITHHWFDSTHITYGVVTAGLASRRWQVEASAFRGEEPNEERWGIETPRLDSWSLRASLIPSDNWTMQVSHGRIKEPEKIHPGEDEARTTASVHYNSGTGLSALLAFSAKNRLPGSTLTAWIGEAAWEVTPRHAVFARYENVANAELFPDHDDPLHDQTFRVAKLQGGYAYSVPLGSAARVALGGSLAAYFKPSALDPVYGESPLGYTLFARLMLGGL